MYMLIFVCPAYVCSYIAVEDYKLEMRRSFPAGRTDLQGTSLEIDFRIFGADSVCGCGQMHLDYLLNFVCLIVIDQRGKKILRILIHL